MFGQTVASEAAGIDFPIRKSRRFVIFSLFFAANIAREAETDVISTAHAKIPAFHRFIFIPPDILAASVIAALFPLYQGLTGM